MAVNKNFVVKNGIEVATDLIYATSGLDKVGIGTTIPTSTLEVGGAFKATGNSTLVGSATVQDTFDVGVGGTVITADVQAGRIGLHTATARYNVHISNAGSSSTSLYVDGGHVKVDSDIYADNIYLPGGSISGGSISVGNIYASGVSTFIGDVDFSGTVTGASFGIGAEGTFVGSGVTQLNINSTSGTNVVATPAVSGIATVTVTPGVSIGLAIALGG